MSNGWMHLSGRTAIKIFPRLAELKLSTEDAAEAVAENTAYVAIYRQDNTNTPVDVSCTCFRLGWEHRSLVLVTIWSCGIRRMAKLPVE